jgi:hypothetical protein
MSGFSSQRDVLAEFAICFNLLVVSGLCYAVHIVLITLAFIERVFVYKLKLKCFIPREQTLLFEFTIYMETYTGYVREVGQVQDTACVRLCCDHRVNWYC